MAITSYLPGRIRLQDQRLAQSSEADRIRSMLLALPGIKEATVNRRNASMLVTYNPLSGVEELLRNNNYLADRAESTKLKPVSSRGKSRKQAKKGSPLPFTGRQFLNYGMMITFAASGIGIALHYKKLHALAGFLFIGIGSLHMYDKRKTLFI
jgi:cation transport ATPase